MMTIFHSDVLPWCVPLIYVLAGVPATLGVNTARAWRIAENAAAAALFIALAAIAAAAWQAAALRLPADMPGLAMLLLISVLAWVIVRYSRRYLRGEPAQQRYIGAMLNTLAAVSVVALAGDLLVLALAWSASSLCLHRLLTFYGERPAALVVAHKKFIASRLAELCLLAALLLIHREAGTLSLQGIASHVAQWPTLSAPLAIAMVLIALAVILKSAQLPVHGWLLQVMEAPTPVSALLHAGIVNLGGFVLIRLAALLSIAPAAQTMLVAAGSLSAVLAGLVMMTRISIKVRLAWSTCAQMGFMLLECGLGLYDLAFLHLIAHSLYKAHAFLSAGEAVLDTRRRHLLPAAPERAPAAVLQQRLVAATLALALVAASVAVWQLALPRLAVPAVVIWIVGLGLAPLLWRDDESSAGKLRGALASVVLAQLYLGWHLVFGALVSLPAASASLPLALWVGACFAIFYLLQARLLAFPRGALSTALYPWAYAGFHLDQRFTRLSFRVWPLRMPAPPLDVFSGEKS